MKTLAYMGWLGHKNIGDEACFAAICSWLPADVQIETWDIEPWGKPTLPDAVIVGGGTLLDLGLDARAKAIYQLVESHVPTVFWGTGVLPLEGECSKLVIQMLQNAKSVGVRGPRSYYTLVSNGFHQCAVIGDPALLLQTPEVPLGTNSRTIAINIGDARGRLFGKEDELLHKIQKLIEMLVSRGYKIILFSMWPADNKYLERIPVNNNVRLRPYDPSWISLIDFFKRCYCVIGMKLHAAVLSAAATVPFITIAYRDKCIDFAESVKLGAYAVRSDDKNLSERIINLVNGIELHYASLVATLTEQKSYYRGFHQQLGKLMAQILGV